jgi:D-cysteine desulfhydrase
LRAAVKWGFSDESEAEKQHLVGELTMYSNIPWPARVALANTPTPLAALPRLSEKYDVEMYIKRDDYTGMELSGNKVRKLEFSFAEAMGQNADTVLTCGGAQSNHCRATAVAAAKLGMKSRLILRTSDPANPPFCDGNILLDKLVGAEIVWVTPEEYKNREEIFARELEALRRAGRNGYVIPEGASNCIGAWGYIRAVEEIANDVSALPGGSGRPFTIVNAAGSGGTSAGLILGVRLLGLNARVVSVNVCDDRDYFVNAIGKICEETITTNNLAIPFSRDTDVEVLDGYVGRGYALSSAEELKFIRDVASSEGFVLDPVYTGKAFYGMIREMEKNPRVFGDRIVFIHTGGIFGLFPKAQEIAAALWENSNNY